MMGIIQELFTVQCLIALVAGTAGGLLIGALPGLSATMGMSLLIPITYGMETAPAMIMIAAVYVSAVYGGSFSAILIHTPGTPASAATAIDGYELTKQGKGLKAVGVSSISSVTGGGPAFSGAAACKGIADVQFTGVFPDRNLWFDHCGKPFRRQHAQGTCGSGIRTAAGNGRHEYFPVCKVFVRKPELGQRNTAGAGYDWIVFHFPGPDPVRKTE